MFMGGLSRGRSPIGRGLALERRRSRIIPKRSARSRTTPRPTTTARQRRAGPQEHECAIAADDMTIKSDPSSAIRSLILQPTIAGAS